MHEMSGQSSNPAGVWHGQPAVNIVVTIAGCCSQVQLPDFWHVSATDPADLFSKSTIARAKASWTCYFLWQCTTRDDAQLRSGAMLDKAEKPAEKPADKPADKKEPVVIKKYANRRLYNTETSTYVTLDDLAAMVKSERDFIVYDAKSGDELTHAVLTQIIVEQESRMGGGQTMLPIPFLQQLIRFYGGNMQKMVPSYLQVSLASFAKEQERFTKQFSTTFTPAGAFEVFQDQARRNVALFEQAMGMFVPFGGVPKTPGMPDPTAPAGQAAAPQPAPARSDDLAEMKAQMTAMQAMIEKLSRDKT
jgi:polyhydroxyalkanoate synthesis repressor PhaR